MEKQGNKKLSKLVRLTDITPNYGTVYSERPGDDSEIVYWCPEHGTEPAKGDRIRLVMGSRPTCCPHVDEQ